ncbi:hypothetical protein MF4836_26405 [Pseudomonas sp. MF4836]|nr:hypothetical protein MF4836_26405 [Pseudomonas sp. MF4836]
MRRIVCRRFGASICRVGKGAGCKSDRGIAESVKARQRVGSRASASSVLCPALAPESAALLDASLDLGAATQ